MKPNPLALGDIDCIAFGPNAAFAPYREAARDVAARLAAGGLEPHRAAALVQQLGVADMMRGWRADGDATALLYQLASTLGHADAQAAWAGLADAPAQLLDVPGIDAGGCAVALPRAGRVALGYTAWLPLGYADGGKDGPQLLLCWPAVSLRALHGPRAVTAPAAALLGMPLAQVRHIAAAALPGDGPLQPLASGAWTNFLNAQAALLLGLIDGASRRLVQVAYAYAKQRMSAGKPIAQHQAVALRLADLALNQQALALYAQAAVELGPVVDCPAGPLHANTAHVGDLCFRIARDAVQVAAAHGYVEGLPLRRLFEQLRTLASVLCSVCAGQPATAARDATAAAALSAH